MPTNAPAEGDPATTLPDTSLEELKNALAQPTDLDREVLGEQEASQPEQEQSVQTEDTVPEETEEPVSEEPVPEEPQEPQGTDETPEPETPEPDATDEGEPLKKQRIRPRTPQDQQVMDLYRSEGFDGTYKEAVEIIYGAQPQAEKSTETEAEAPDPLASDRQKLESVQSEIREIEEQLSNADGELDSAEAFKLQRQILRKENELARIETRIEIGEREADQQVQQTRRNMATESRDRALERYPVLKDTETVDRKRFDAYLAAAQRDPVQSPIFQSPLWPEIMADRFAAENGMQAAGAKPQATAPARPANRRATGTQARQLTTGEREGGAQITAETVRGNLPNYGRDALFGLLG